jgi:hypothetical protein
MASAREKHALVLFNTLLLLRRSGTFQTNMEFRKNVIEAFEEQFFITRSSASTLYNCVKKLAESLDPALKLGRDSVRPAKASKTRASRQGDEERRYVHVVGMRSP